MNEGKLNTEMESSGTWPEHALDDINTARHKISVVDWDDHPNVNVYVGTSACHSFDHRLVRDYSLTYRRFLENNNLATIHELKQEEARMVEFKDHNIILSVNEAKRIDSSTAFVRYKGHEVVIKNIELKLTKDCDFCSGEIDLNGEAVKLLDDRLVCDACYAKVFESILLN